MSNTIQKNELVEFLEQFVKERGSFIIEWDGGNDNGCYTVSDSKGRLSHEEQIKYPLIQEAVNRLNRYLGYGSFAGDFHTCGSVEYIQGEGVLKGGNYYSTMDQDTISLRTSDIVKTLSPIRLEIPEDLWFESISIHTAQEFDVTFSFTVEGPVSEMHIYLEKDIAVYLMNEYKERIDQHVKQNRGKYGDCNVCLGWEEYILSYKDFKLDKKKKVRYVDIDSMSCVWENEESSSVVINL